MSKENINELTIKDKEGNIVAFIKIEGQDITEVSMHEEYALYIKPIE